MFKSLPQPVRALLSFIWSVLKPPPSNYKLPRVRLSRRAARRSALILTALLMIGSGLIGAPAQAQLPIPDIPGVPDCKDEPNPERPGSGLVGVLDPTPIDQGSPGSIYRDYGYAGQVWHTYDLGCGGTGREPMAAFDTWVGNQAFNTAKALVGLTNGLHYALFDGGVVEPLDNMVMSGTMALYDSVYTPLFGLMALLLAVILFRSIWRGDLSTVTKRSFWALAATWFAAAMYLTPLTYMHVLDDFLIEGTSQMQAGFYNEVGVEPKDQLPTLLHDTVVFNNWKRGEFGSPTSPKAEQYGRPLVDAQAWTKEQIASGADNDASQLKAKQEAYERIAGDMGSSYGQFQGKDGSRIGAGFLALGQASALSLFQLLAKLAILLGQVLLRVLILVGPLVGLVAIIRHDVLRAVGRAAGTAVIHVLVMAAMAGLHGFILTQLFDPANNIPPLGQLLLAAVITVIFLMVVRPIRRIVQMAQTTEAAASEVALGRPKGPGTLSRLLGRGKGGEPSAQERFWRELEENESPSAHVSPEVIRPEATIIATAFRTDGNHYSVHPELGTPHRALPPADPASGSRSEGVTSADTTPVFVPSQDAVGEPTPPSRGEPEVVNGRPVHVVLRKLDPNGTAVYDITTVGRRAESPPSTEAR